jgi:hypothetical protein
MNVGGLLKANSGRMKNESKALEKHKTERHPPVFWGTLRNLPPYCPKHPEQRGEAPPVKRKVLKGVARKLLKWWVL